MPYQVLTTTTPLWADHQKTKKKGIVARQTVFKADHYDEDSDMLKTSSVEYTPKDSALAVVGDGWIERKNCAVLMAPGDPPGGSDPVPVVLKAGRYRISGEVTIEELGE